jgi:L-iditol 2-dehydrogenase
MKNQTAFLAAERHIEIRDTAMPVMGEDDVLIKICHVTICGSDSYFFKDPTFGGRFIPPVLPIVLGHESGGIVVEAGKNVTGLKPGDKVAIEPGDGCGHCKYCLEGRYNLCRSMNFMAAAPFKRGALSRYITHPASKVFKLPGNMDTIEGALIEPLAVGMHAVNRSGARLGMTAVVLGCGCIGLVTIASLKAIGIDNIIVSDLFANRLENAVNMGAAVTIDASKNSIVEEVLKLTGGIGADCVFETAGSSTTAALTADIAAPGGKIVMVGNIHGKTPFRFLDTNDKEVDIISVFRYVNDYPMAINSVSSGKINVKSMISRVFPFEQTQQAFDCTLDEKDTVMKVAIEF